MPLHQLFRIVWQINCKYFIVPANYVIRVCARLRVHVCVCVCEGESRACVRARVCVCRICLCLTSYLCGLFANFVN